MLHQSPGGIHLPRVHTTQVVGHSSQGLKVKPLGRTHSQLGSHVSLPRVSGTAHSTDDVTGPQRLDECPAHVPLPEDRLQIRRALRPRLCPNTLTLPCISSPPHAVNTGARVQRSLPLVQRLKLRIERCLSLTQRRPLGLGPPALRLHRQVLFTRAGLSINSGPLSACSAKDHGSSGVSEGGLSPRAATCFAAWASSCPRS